MDNSKRILSIILSIFMLFSIVNPASLVAADETKPVESNVIKVKIEGDKEVFTFDLSKIIKKESAARMSLKAMPTRAPLRSPVSYDTKVNVKVVGLNNGTFDWEALPNKEFKLIAKWETKDGEKHEKPFATITEAGITTYNVGWPIDGTMKGDASIETDYNQNIEVRVVDIYVSSTGGAGKLVFDITLKELAESRANVEYVDPYGRQLTDTNDLPASTDTMPKVTADELTDVEIDLPRTAGQISMRESDDIDEDELNEAENGLTYKVDNKAKNEKVTIGKKEYKLDISQPSAKEIGTIKMVYQKDVLVPPTKDDGSGDPVDPAEGYVRLTFDANENKQDGITGKHTAGAYQGKQKSYIDVKQGVQYDNANLQAAIKELATTGTKLVGTETKEYAQDAKNPWTPTVPDDTTSVTTATYNAQYEKTTADKVKALGGLKGVDFAEFVGATLDWKKGVAPADAVKDADKATIENAIKEATVEDTTNPQRTTATKGTFPGTLKVTFKDGSVYVVKAATKEGEKDDTNIEQKLYVYDKGDEKPDDPKQPVPDKTIYVAFDRDEKSVKETGFDANAKPLMYAEGDVVPDAKFPNAQAADGFKAVEWTPAKTTALSTKDKAYDAQTKTFTFKASGTNDDSKPAKPTVDPIKEGDKDIKVEEPKDGDKVVIVIPDPKDPTNKEKDTKITVEKDDKGDWKDDKGKPINKEDGKLVIPVPDDAEDKIVKDNEVTVTVTDKTTYKTSDPTEVTIDGKETPIPPTPTPEKSDKPIINPIYDSDDYVTGEGVPGATVEVRFPDGTIERVIVDGDGRWVAPTPYPLYDEEIVEARQIEFGKEPSDWVFEKVRYDDEYWRERDRRDRDDKKEDTKKPSKVEPRWTPPALNARDHFSYIKGYGNNIFGPNRTITRAEVAMIFARISVNQSTGGAPQFKDVKAGDWYKTAVDIMAKQGIVKGYEDGTFRPNQPITRREFAAIAARYAGNLDTWKTFRDVPPTDWAYKLINRVAGAGWINGYEDGTFRPNNNITRAEVVAIVNRMLNRKADAKYVDNNLMRTKGAFVDNMRSAWYYYDIYEAAFGHSYERLDNGVDEKWNRVTGQAFEIRER